MLKEGEDNSIEMYRSSTVHKTATIRRPHYVRQQLSTIQGEDEDDSINVCRRIPVHKTATSVQQAIFMLKEDEDDSIKVCRTTPVHKTVTSVQQLSTIQEEDEDDSINVCRRIPVHKTATSVQQAIFMLKEDEDDSIKVCRTNPVHKTVTSVQQLSTIQEEDEDDSINVCRRTPVHKTATATRPHCVHQQTTIQVEDEYDSFNVCRRTPVHKTATATRPHCVHQQTTIQVEDEYDSINVCRKTPVHKTATATRPHCVHQALATLVLSMGALSSGLAKGYTSTVLDSLLHNQSTSNTGLQDFFASQQDASWIASLSLLGAMIGALQGKWIMAWGRRLPLRIISVLLVAVWVFTSIASNVITLYVTTMIGGFCCSVITMVAQIYISEISMPSIRGRLSAVLKVFGHVGVLLAYTAGMYLNWRLSALLMVIPSSMLFMGSFFIPETPSYLLLKNRTSEAINSLRWLRGKDVDVRVELLTIHTNAIVSRREQSKLTFRNSIHTPKLYKPIAITCGLMFFLRFSGADAFKYYSVITFRQTMSGMNPYGAAIAVSFVQLVGSLMSGLMIDIVGRVWILTTSMIAMSFALIGFGCQAHFINQTLNLEYPDTAMVSQYEWIQLFCVIIFTTALAVGISPISWLLSVELFPLEYRDLGTSISTAFSYFFAFVGTKLFMDFEQMLGVYGAFWLYAIVAAFGLCFVLKCVPETKNTQLDEMLNKT